MSAEVTHPPRHAGILSTEALFKMRPRDFEQKRCRSILVPSRCTFTPRRTSVICRTTVVVNSPMPTIKILGPTPPQPVLPTVPMRSTYDFRTSHPREASHLLGITQQVGLQTSVRCWRDWIPQRSLVHRPSAPSRRAAVSSRWHSLQVPAVDRRLPTMSIPLMAVPPGSRVHPERRIVR